jgi:hypothetical protein
MFILTIHGREREGAYSVINEYGENIFYLFEEEDDAVRYSMMLEESGFPEMHIIEVEDELMLETCNVNDYKYTVITSNDIVIPPKY